MQMAIEDGSAWGSECYVIMFMMTLDWRFLCRMPFNPTSETLARIPRLITAEAGIRVNAEKKMEKSANGGN